MLTFKPCMCKIFGWQLFFFLRVNLKIPMLYIYMYIHVYGSKCPEMASNTNWMPANSQAMPQNKQTNCFIHMPALTSYCPMPVFKQISIYMQTSTFHWKTDLINLKLGDAKLHDRCWSSLVQVMACCLIGILSESFMTYHPTNLLKTTETDFPWKYNCVN